MINYSDFPLDSWDKPVDISEIRKIIKEEVKAELTNKQLEEKKTSGVVEVDGAVEVDKVVKEIARFKGERK